MMQISVKTLDSQTKVFTVADEVRNYPGSEVFIEFLINYAQRFSFMNILWPSFYILLTRRFV